MDRASTAALHVARSMRRAGELAAELIDCRDVRFRALPPQSIRAEHVAGLSHAEAEVWSELSRSQGNLVLISRLVQRLAATSSQSGVKPGYVKTLVLRLRRKLAAIGGDPAMLRNVRGLGYMLVG